jgi:hypothetical protein
MVMVIIDYESIVGSSTSPITSFATAIVCAGYITGTFWTLLWLEWTEGTVFCSWRATPFWLVGAGKWAKHTFLESRAIQANEEYTQPAYYLQS